MNFIFLLNSGNDTYKNRLIAFIDKLNITDYTIISERLSDEEYLDLMAKINVHLNLRKTDHLNSSMLEFLYSQAVEIIGGWLPYNDLDEWGVFTIRIDDFSALTNALERAISIVGSAPDNRLYKNRLIIKSRFYPDDVLKKMEFTDKLNATGMKAVILAGGLGMRLRPFTETIPKPLLPIGEKAVLEIQIDHLKRYGFNEIFLATNYMSNILRIFSAMGKNTMSSLR